MQLAEKQANQLIYYIMSDQPDCCSECGSRLDLVEIRVLDSERIFVSECLGCHHEVLVVED